MNEVNAQRTLQVLKHAVDLDTNNRFTEALLCYQEGVHLTADIIKAGKKDVTEATISPLRAKMEQYVTRVEKIKTSIAQGKERGNYHERVIIDNNSTGHSYDSLFGRFLDEDIRIVVVEDPYIRNFEQCQNFLRLCELLVRKCSGLKHLVLVTSRADRSEGHQGAWLTNIRSELATRRIKFTVKFSHVFHETGITLSNGWIIRITKGLNIYKPSGDRFSLGAYDFNLRPCHETKLDIFYSKNFKPLRHLFMEHAFYSCMCRIFAAL